jgi:hypothetical protein
MITGEILLASCQPYLSLYYPADGRLVRYLKASLKRRKQGNTGKKYASFFPNLRVAVKFLCRRIE